ncbi:hypothetical protein [Agrococcus jejuensis]|uniref:Uncharacterized protein n=1 Tax=Agrococcus jejuensis TaxID=399736 RepID=A0A1G8DBK0_9MICO|nr:hypothetical protein [Agrococcus jejuensis]SDH55082.1 hypothetical protein SAMN04489720_1588 [Agrococcus jejuensis]
MAAIVHDETLTIEVVPFEPMDARARVLAAARDLGLLGVVLPAGDAGTVEVIVAARGAEPLVVRDDAVVPRSPHEVVESLRMRCAASVACYGDHDVVAESVLPAALERAEQSWAAIPVPTTVAAIAPTLPTGTTASELALAFGVDVVDVVVEGRQLVMGRAVHGVPWSPATRPVVAMQRSATAATVAIWTADAVRMRQSPIAREQAMLDPDLVLAWIQEPDRIGGDALPTIARDLEDAVVERHRPQVTDEGRVVVERALAELGLASAIDELATVIESPLAEDTVDRVVAVLGLPAVVADVLHDRVHPDSLPGARLTPHRGTLRTIASSFREAAHAELGTTFGGEMRQIAAEELGADWRDRDRRRRRWLAAVLAPLLAVGNLGVAVGVIPLRPEPNAWYLVPAVAFAGIAVWSIRWLVVDARRRRDVDDPSGAG